MSKFITFLFATLVLLSSPAQANYIYTYTNQLDIVTTDYGFFPGDPIVISDPVPTQFTIALSFHDKLLPNTIYELGDPSFRGFFITSPILDSHTEGYFIFSTDSVGVIEKWSVGINLLFAGFYTSHDFVGFTNKDEWGYMDNYSTAEGFTLFNSAWIESYQPSPVPEPDVSAIFLVGLFLMRLVTTRQKQFNYLSHR